VDGESVAPEPVLGWASRYDVQAGGPAELAYSTPVSQVVLHLIQLAFVATLPWARRRRISEFRVRSTRSRGTGTVES
ncbi:MAG TPA: hypothetical protein PLS46_08675, partial [Microthrixaceae bacterium]|nr:hypothetical protein [Microthrixaceae bacterium]